MLLKSLTLLVAVTIAYVIGIRSLPLPIFFFTFEMSLAQAGVIIFRFPPDDSWPDVHQLFSCQTLRNLLINEPLL